MWSRRRDRWSLAARITVVVTVVAVQCVAAGGNADVVQLHNEMPIDVEAFEEQADAELLEFVGLSLNETMEMSDVSAQGWSRGRYAENFKIPSKYSSIQRYCSHLNRVKDSTLSAMYERAVPLTGNMPHGCNPGCLIGTSYGATMNRGPSGGDNAEWVGKCFYPASGRVKNQISANPWYTFGAIEPIMIEAFEAKVYVGESWYNKTENAIIIDYDDTPRQYGRSFQCYRDEMREVSPGFFLGRLYAKPFSFCDQFNPLPFPYFVLHFAVFQAPIIFDDDARAPKVQGFSGPHY